MALARDKKGTRGETRFSLCGHDALPSRLMAIVFHFAAARKSGQRAPRAPLMSDLIAAETRSARSGRKAKGGSSSM